MTLVVVVLLNFSKNQLKLVVYMTTLKFLHASVIKLRNPSPTLTQPNQA